MKNNIIARLAFLLVAVMLFPACGETYIEENQNAYTAQDVVPLVLGTSGPSLVLQTFVYDFMVTYDRSGSEWNWSSSDATIQSVSSDTRTATILFDQLPASGTAVIKVTETTAGGVTSPEKTIEVTVKQFCPLPNGANSLVGSWSGDDAFYSSIITTTAASATVLNVTGMSIEFIEDWWAETVIDGGTIQMTINNDGTVDIPRQYIYTTEYDGDPYDYEIEGSGVYDFCPANPTMVITYDIYYEGDDVGLAETYSPAYLPTPYLTADIVLDGKKGTVKSMTALPPRPSKK